MGLKNNHNNSPCCAPAGNQQDLRKPILDKVEKTWKHFSKSGMIDLSGGKFLMGTDSVSYTHLTLPTTPYV